MKIIVSILIQIFVASAFAASGHGDPNHIPMGFVISQIVNFAILVGIIWYFAGAAIKNHFIAQKASYLEGMESASKAVSLAETRKKEIDARIAELRSNTESDIADANKNAEEAYRIELANAKNEALKIEKDTMVALEAETQKAIEALRVETFAKSAEYAENKMGKEFSPDQQQAWNGSFSNRLKQGVH